MLFRKVSGYVDLKTDHYILVVLGLLPCLLAAMSCLNTSAEGGTKDFQVDCVKKQEKIKKIMRSKNSIMFALTTRKASFVPRISSKHSTLSFLFILSSLLLLYLNNGKNGSLQEKMLAFTFYN